MLQRGDIFLVNNCTIHKKGNNVRLQKELFFGHGILMITLPPYHPNFNLTELLFNTLLQRLSSQRARYNYLFTSNFLHAIHKAMIFFELEDVISF